MPDTATHSASAYSFLSDGGEMGALMRTHDWSTSSLGNPDTWPQALRTAVRLMLNTGHPMYIFWGEAGACLYNDAYRLSIGPERHPTSLGRPAREVWDEIWDIIGPQIEQVMAGRGATWHENQLVPITRNGRREDVYWTYSYSPIDDETARRGVGGVLVVCSETTRHVATERMLQARIEERTTLLQSLRDSEALYRSAIAAGRMGAWETDFKTRTRTWSKEGMSLFGLSLADGRGQVGGEADEFALALHPDDRHLVRRFHKLANEQDSFAAEYRIVRPDGAVLWLAGRGQVVDRAPDGKANRLINIVADITDRKSAEDHIQFLMREMTHRSKNLLTVVQSIARRTAKSTGSLDEFERRFGQRLQGLAASHDVLVNENWRGAPLAELVREQLLPFVEAQSARVKLEGPPVVLTAQAAQAIGLAIHELATNAIKYGALSVAAGKVRVSWMADADAPSQVRLTWAEQGGPPVHAPSHKGFGHMVIDDMIARALNGSVAMEFAPQGFHWTVSIPAANLVSSMP
jgi:PAS domain S-box-containing protein